MEFDSVLGVTPFQKCPAHSVLGTSGGKGSFEEEDMIITGALTPPTRRAAGQRPIVEKGESRKDDTEIGTSLTHVAQGGQEHQGSRSTAMLRAQGDAGGTRKRRVSPHSAPIGVPPKRRIQMSSVGVGKTLHPGRHGLNELGGGLVMVDQPPGPRLKGELQNPMFQAADIISQSGSSSSDCGDLRGIT